MIKVLLLGLILLISSPAFSQVDTMLESEERIIQTWEKNQKLQRFLDYYFLNKPAYLVPAMTQKLIDHGYMDQEPEKQNYVIGLYAGIFKDNASLVPEWLNSLQLTQYQAGTLIRALRHAGLTQEVNAWVESRQWQYPAGTVFSPLPHPFDDSLVNPESIQRFWGAYVSEGSIKYLDVLFDRYEDTFTEVDVNAINRGEFDSFKKKSLHEMIQGLFISAGIQYKDVRDYLTLKLSNPHYQNNEGLQKMVALIYKRIQERAEERQAIGQQYE